MPLEVNNNKIKTDEARRLSRRRFIGRSVLGLAGLSVAGAVSANQIDDLQLIDLRVEVPGWPSASNGFTIAQLSDLHCDDQDSINRVHRGVKWLLDAQPNVCVVTGDFISRGNITYLGDVANALSPLNSLPSGAYAILGNHDYERGSADRIASVISSAGFEVLRNQSVPIGGVQNAYFVGVDDAIARCNHVERAVAGLPPGSTRILLVHEPDFADVAGPGFALQLSGHSHGGQIRVPGLPPIHEPTMGRQYPEGLQQAANHLVYTSRGVGVTGPKLRLYCKPDVTLLRLYAPSA